MFALDFFNLLLRFERQKTKLKIIFYYGLPENINTNYLIILLILYIYKKSFILINFKVWMIMKRILQLIKKISKWFSIFCSSRELEIINDYNDDNNDNSNNSLLNDINS